MRISDWSSDVCSSDLGKGPPQPIGTLEERISLTNPAAAAIPGTYILTMDQGAKVDAFSGAAARARRKIWPVHVLHTGHLPQVTMPATLADLLIEAALARQPYSSCQLDKLGSTSCRERVLQ